MPKLSDRLLERPVPLAGRLAVLLALVVLAADLMTWVELDVSAVYPLPLVLVAVARNRRLLWAMAGCLIFVTFAAYAIQIEDGGFYLYEPFFINRVLSAVTLMVSAVLCHIWIIAADSLAAQSRRAEEANLRKTQLLASVSHDIRTPLATIDLIADLIRRSADNAMLAAKVPGLVQRLHRNTRSLADLVCALLDISSLDAGRMALNNGEFSLNALLEDECQRLQPLAQAKSLRLTVEAPEPPVTLLADRIKLSRVLSNLVGNAIKFTETGGVTLAAAVEPEHSLRIRVSDSGIGMTAQNAARIFDEYGQLGNPERDSSKGWGLGLAICRRLVYAMGGTIAVESERDRGTTFSVHLPAACVISP
jgi:signal transduction histidine kinase